MNQKRINNCDIYTNDFDEPLAVVTERWLTQNDLLKVVWEAFDEADRDHSCARLSAIHGD